MAVVDDLKEIATLVGGEWSQSPVVEDEEFDPRQRLEQACMASVAACQRQASNSRGMAMVEDRTIVAACLVAQRACDPALADAGGAGDKQVLLARDPVTIDQLGKEGPLDARGVRRSISSMMAA